jgi:type VII secretion-associated serine protease mycosin
LVAIVTTTIMAVSAMPGAASADQVRDLQWHLRFLNIAGAHRITTGTGQVVAVIDSGVDSSHPDLASNVLPGTDFVQPPGDGRRDVDGHGTSLAGLIAAHGRGGAGILGVAPGARILPVRTALNDEGFALAEAVNWATDHGATVISVSRGSPTRATVEELAVKRALDKGVVVVASAGNTDRNALIGYPAAYPGVVAVGGVDRNGEHASFAVTGGQLVVSAPAVDILAAAPGGGTQITGGTSAATAIVAGAVALIRARYPQLNARQVIDRLTATATDKGPPGRDYIYGYGVIDIVKALTADLPAEAASPSPSQTNTASPPRKSGGPIAAAVFVGALVVLSLILGGGYIVYRRRLRR